MAYTNFPLSQVEFPNEKGCGVYPRDSLLLKSDTEVTNQPDQLVPMV